jgi:hypothetical protein
MKQANEEIVELKKQNSNLQKQVEGEKRETESLHQQVQYLLASNAPTESKLHETIAQLEATATKLATKEVSSFSSLLFVFAWELSESPILYVVGPLVPFPIFHFLYYLYLPLL